MDISYLLDDLNDAQREAVSAPPGHYLVLAGAGSGKTRVLTHRIAWLCEVVGVWPHQVLAVTFTNKAAGEMRGRCEKLLQRPSKGLWIGTFHGLAHRLLRLHWREAGLPETFQILDAEDQTRLVKRVIQQLNLDETRYPPRQGAWQINQWKDEGRRAGEVDARRGDPYAETWRDVYAAYEQACERQGLVDFAELLLRSHRLWLTQPALLAHYQQRFTHILLDEFQDTNAIQYAWVRVLAGERAEVYAVGDDDQSIYSWRGAKVEHMQAFRRDFPGASLIRLTQNYRSTSTILNAANAVIARNKERLGKDLWTEAGKGDPIALYAAYNEQDEARYVVDRLRRLLDGSVRAQQCAILYRANALSRVLEEELVRHGLPYRIYGGVRFFERAEVKDALAWLRLAAHAGDDTAFERAIATPARGVGARTLEDLRELARERELSLLDASRLAVAGNLGLARARSGLAQLLAVVDEVAAARELKLAERLDLLLERSGLRAHYEAMSKHEADSRVANLDELVSVARGFVLSAEDEAEGYSELTAFLSQAALEAGEQQGETWDDCVQLMTLHAAKGLEFDYVFLVGMEDGLFPSDRSTREGAEKLEEERRLAYVGITRARRELSLSYAESRRLRGSEHYNGPSRFLSEIPPELMRELRPRAKLARSPSFGPPPRLRQEDWMDQPPIQLGTRVAHAQFGEGVVVGAEGAGAHARLRVNFESEGLKWLIAAHANLKVLEG